MEGVMKMIILYHKIMVYSPRVVKSYVFENDTSTLKQIKITKNIQEKPKKKTWVCSLSLSYTNLFPLKKWSDFR